MRVIGIETSCDETGVAVFDSEHGLLAHELYSQVKLHADYGGVVPELASRDHIRKTLPLVKSVLNQAALTAANIDGVAYTGGPGLVGALLVGTAIGRSLAWAWKVPAIMVHHMEAHLLAPMLEKTPPEFPFLALLVSGGHSLLVKVSSAGQYETLGATLDDAAGEAFDKTAKLLGLGYPGGPALARLAARGDSSRFRFPRPMTNRPGLDFSFSGLKTYARNISIKYKDDEQTRADIACAFQDAMVETLAIKCRRALRETGLKRLVVAGGVSANHQLRQCLIQMVGEERARVYYPRQEFCTDNGAMVAYAGYLRLCHGQREPLSFDVKVRWPMDSLST